jgi:hypothetical protein
MSPPASVEHDKNHRFPGEIISPGVWLYHRFPLSYRDVQELLFERGIDVTHEAIRQWCLKFGQDYANQLKHRRAQPDDTWHLDEVDLTINGKRHDLWRAVDQDDNVLDILVQSHCNKNAAKSGPRLPTVGGADGPQGVDQPPGFPGIRRGKIWEALGEDAARVGPVTAAECPHAQLDVDRTRSSG